MRDIKRIPEDLRTCFFNVPLATDAADAIEELLAAVPKWISVEERLPKFGERVLVSNGGFVCESFLSQSGRWQRGGVDMFFMTPTHWCEMPESPKEENKR